MPATFVSQESNHIRGYRFRGWNIIATFSPCSSNKFGCLDNQKWRTREDIPFALLVSKFAAFWAFFMVIWVIKLGRISLEGFDEADFEKFSWFSLVFKGQFGVILWKDLNQSEIAFWIGPSHLLSRLFIVAIGAFKPFQNHDSIRGLIVLGWVLLIKFKSRKYSQHGLHWYQLQLVRISEFLYLSVSYLDWNNFPRKLH